MKTRLTLIAALVVALYSFLLSPAPARADGFIVIQCPPTELPPNPPPQPGLPPILPPIRTPIPPIAPRPPVCTNYLAVKNHNVTVTIDNQIAHTHVDETFLNASANQLEGTYIFPLPDDATISNFAMWMDGKKVDGQVLDKNQARQIYEDIVRRQRDPALLEYIGHNAFQARIFPIPPRSEKKVELDYAQVLQADQGLVRYIYPLNTEKFSPKPLTNVSVSVSISSKTAIKAIYSPSHNVSVLRDGDYRAKVGYEDANVKPDRDFILYYSVTQDDIGVNLLSYKPYGSVQGDDGFFLLLVAPKIDIPKSQVIAKDVIVVLDVSGSMQGQKIDQAKRSLYYVLDQLNPDDRFNIISFSTGTNAFASSLQPVSARSEARNFVTSLRAEGSTDINRALLEALSLASKSSSAGSSTTNRPAIVVFITDGQPTTGESNTDKIIANATNSAPKNVRLFTFGLGDDVNTVLLDSLAEKLRGASAYVRPNEKIDEIVSAFYARVSVPVLSDISIDWGGVAVNDVYPYPLPDLFAGTQLVVAGRYRNGGPMAITLKGNVNGTPQTFRYSDMTLANSGSSLDESFIPRLWATRKIGYLLNQVRLHGEAKETVNEIVTLAVRYGIVTPYTSFLVDERKDVLTESGRGGAAQDMSKSLAPSSQPAVGATAVQQSQQQNSLRGAVVPPAMPTAAPRAGAPAGQAQSAPIQLVGDKTFLLRSGVWTDTQFDPSKMTTKKTEFGSPAYFALNQNPELGKYLALGSHLIVVLNGTAYEITDDGTGATASSDLNSSGIALVQPTLDPGPFKPHGLVAEVGLDTQATAPGEGIDRRLVAGGGLAGVGLLGTVGAALALALKRS